MALSELEKQRQENIQRNKELMRQLQLDTLGADIAREVPKPEKKRKTTRLLTPKVKRETPEPSRRSRRLAGVKTEDTEEFARLRAEEDEADRQRKEMEKLKQTRLFGDFKLIDLITNKKGGLQFKNRVYLKNEAVKEEPRYLGDDEGDHDVDVDAQKKLLDRLLDMGERFSAGDFFDDIRKKAPDAEQTRAELEKLRIYQRFEPLSIKITHNRVTLMCFHPAVDDRMVIAGDTTGCMGIWAVDSGLEEPAVSILKPHGKLVLRILCLPKEPLLLLTASYDGLVRRFDLNKQTSLEVAYVSDPWDDLGEPLGVSDINFCGSDPKVVFLTTLEGNFYRFDPREPFKLKKSQLLRCHDKKIGSFAVNPNGDYQIATASLDRSLRVWDLRTTSACQWSEYEDQTAPHLTGGFTLRLLVSCVDWNTNNRLVCNGYDDKIQLFDLDAQPGAGPCAEWKKQFTLAKGNPKPKEYDELPLEALKPLNTIRHNCQTGRWVSILKLKWQQSPEDGVQKFVIANMNRGLDIYNEDGTILAHLNEDVGAVPAVAALHPTKNWCVGGSANGKVYFFE